MPGPGAGDLGEGEAVMMTLWESEYHPVVSVVRSTLFKGMSAEPRYSFSFKLSKFQTDTDRVRSLTSSSVRRYVSYGHEKRKYGS